MANRSRQASRLWSGVVSRVGIVTKERIKSYITNFIKDNAHFSKMASIAILGVIIPVSIIPIAASKNDETFRSKVVFDKNEAIVDYSSKKIAIVPGESQFQAQERAKAEAEAAARAAAEAAKKPERNVVSREKRVYTDPSNFDGIYQAAGAAYSIDWRILKAIHYVETGCSGSTSKRNPSGATGPMQFIPSTWRHYGADGNGDSVADITNVKDAIYAAAHYLAASGGAANNYRTALWSYNRSTSYYNKVMDVARGLGF